MPIDFGGRRRQTPSDEPPPRGSGGTGSTSSGDENRGINKPLGVPAGYTTRGPRDLTGMGARAAEGWAAQGKGHGTITTLRPRYFDGSQYRFANAGPDQILQIQRAMWDAGLYSGPIDQVGVWSGNTVNAYKNLLEYANSAGISADDALLRMQQSGGGPGIGGGGEDGGGGGGGGTGGIIGYDENGAPIYAPFVPPPLQAKVSNKDDLRKVFRRAVIDALGEGWSQAQINELVDAYNWQELKVQKDAYDQEVKRMEDEYYGRPSSSEPIVSVDMASPETFIEEEARRRDPAGFQATEIGGEGGYADQFFAALGGYT